MIDDYKMFNSPEKKKIKLSSKAGSEKYGQKRENDDNPSSIKRRRLSISKEEELQAMKRKNFIRACEQASCTSYFDIRRRFALVDLPSCVKFGQEHDHETVSVKEMAAHEQEAFNIRMKTNMFHEAIIVCQLCSTKTKYLSANVLKDIAEIMLNTHDNECSEFSVSDIISQCQLVFTQNLSFHPPCINKKIRKCYLEFLTSPMNLRANTFTNRKQFQCENGLVKYCLNRLEHEISLESKDEPLIDKNEHIPEDMKESVKGLHWQKEKFELYELLDRNERIDRLMVFMESVVELLQFDLAVWHSRYTSHLSSHIMRSHKPLMAIILWSDNVLFTGGVNSNCRQILKIFTYLVHMKYPQKHLDIMTTLLNLTVETFYICETNANSDYPNIGKYCSTFAREFYKIISVMPHSSILRIISAIRPSFMQSLVGNLHINELLHTDETCVLKNLIAFLKEQKWRKLQILSSELEIPKKKQFGRLGRKLNYLSKLCKKYEQVKHMQYESMEYSTKVSYPKYSPVPVVKETSLNNVVEIFYLTLETYLEAYNVQKVQDNIDTLNKQLLIPNYELNDFSTQGSFSVTEQFIKKYRSIYQQLQELVLLLQSMKKNDDVPQMLKIFGNIDLISL